MKKMFYITCVIVVASVIASSVIASLTEPFDKNKVKQDENVANKTYVLSCDEDRLVAYIKGSQRPFIETTTTLSSLPKDVQVQIKKGIEYSSEESLREALNEYCS